MKLIYGELFVSPSPASPHQRVSANLFSLLWSALPSAHEVFHAPYDWRVNRFNVYVPDLMVLGIGEDGAKRLEVPPLLAVEILSPSSWARDLNLKKHAFADAGLPF